MMIELRDDDIQRIEYEIIRVYNDGRACDYTQNGSLLEVRKRMINKRALARQEELLHHIIAFNDALTEALRKMYDRACSVWEAMRNQLDAGEQADLTAKCYLGHEYPALHPLQGDDREDLWDALCDSGWNPLYSDGVTLPTLCFKNSSSHHPYTFDGLIGMDCPPPNWNEGLDRELTKDLHLTSAFHHLFDHTMFAITDFIYVRDFDTEINLNINKSVTPGENR